jgi:hypothetical protein
MLVMAAPNRQQFLAIQAKTPRQKAQHGPAAKLAV